MNSSAELARDKKDFTSKSINKTLNKCRIFSSNDHAIYLALSFHISGNLLKKKMFMRKKKNNARVTIKLSAITLFLFEILLTRTKSIE